MDLPGYAIKYFSSCHWSHSIHKSECEHREASGHMHKRQHCFWVECTNCWFALKEQELRIKKCCRKRNTKQKRQRQFKTIWLLLTKQEYMEMIMLWFYLVTEFWDLADNQSEQRHGATLNAVWNNYQWNKYQEWSIMVNGKFYLVLGLLNWISGALEILQTWTWKQFYICSRHVK